MFVDAVPYMTVVSIAMAVQMNSRENQLLLMSSTLLILPRSGKVYISSVDCGRYGVEAED